MKAKRPNKKGKTHTKGMHAHLFPYFFFFRITIDGGKRILLSGRATNILIPMTALSLLVFSNELLPIRLHSFYLSSQISHLFIPNLNIFRKISAKRKKNAETGFFFQ